METLGGSKMTKCKYCGKEYVKNESDYLKNLSEFFRKKLEYLPTCDCLEKKKEREMEEMERKRVQERMISKVKKFKDISVMDSKFIKSTFKNADMDNQQMQLAQKYVESFMKKDKQEGMLFYGGVGTGKTFTTACIANYLMERGKTVLVINLGLYLNKLTIEWAEAEMNILEQVEKCDLLVIDDFGERLTKKSSMGFGAVLRDTFDKDPNLLSYVTNEDLRTFGMIPEFLGRLPMTVTLQGLDRDMMVRILREPKNAITKQYEKLLAMDEVRLVFEDDALDWIAGEAIKRGTGARALRAILEEFMLDIMYEIPKDSNIGSVVVTRPYLEKSGGPLIRMRG